MVAPASFCFLRNGLRTVVLFAVVQGASATSLPVRRTLAMVESGATQAARGPADQKRGSSGEVSRYQIMPEVWRQYSRSRDYENPEVAWAVAQRILTDRTKQFRQVTGREPEAIELYLLWNRPGHFAEVNYNLDRVKPRYQERARRFANLCGGS